MNPRFMVATSPKLQPKKLLRLLLATLCLGCWLLAGCSNAPPQVTSLTPNNGSTNVFVDASISVVFDHSLNPSSIASRFEIDPAVNNCQLAKAFAQSANTKSPCQINWLANNTGFVFRHPGALFTPNTKYSFTLKAGFADSAGVSNSLDHHWEITTITAPTITNVTPSDGSNNLPLDSSVAINFSANMNATSTVAAISFTPPVPDTVITQNQQDHGRFLVLPGRLLKPHADYTLSIKHTAAEEHGGHLTDSVHLHFRTNDTISSGHSLVLAKLANEHDLTEVRLTALNAVQNGEPTNSEVLLTAKRCGMTNSVSCGPVSAGAPLVTFAEAALAPNLDELAYVENDQTSNPPAPKLKVVKPSEVSADKTPQLSVLGGNKLAWSPNSQYLAYQAPEGIHIADFSKAAITDQLLPGGALLNAAPIWGPDNSTLILSVNLPSQQTRVELADRISNSRYLLPGLTYSDTAGSLAPTTTLVSPTPSGPSSTTTFRLIDHPILSPNGGVLAFRSLTSPAGGNTTSSLISWTIQLSGSIRSPHRLGSGVVPLAFTSDDTLLALQESRSSTPGTKAFTTLVQINLGSGDIQAINGSSEGSSLSSLTFGTPEHRLFYLQNDKQGVVQAYAENADGSNPHQLTNYGRHGMEAAIVMAVG